MLALSHEPPQDFVLHFSLVAAASVAAVVPVHQRIQKLSYKIKNKRRGIYLLSDVDAQSGDGSQFAEDSADCLAFAAGDLRQTQGPPVLHHEPTCWDG